jgi:hypothetical protein
MTLLLRDKPRPLSQVRNAIRYVRTQLATMDGSTAKAIRRIGRQRYKQVILEVLNLLPLRDKPGEGVMLDLTAEGIAKLREQLTDYSIEMHGEGMLNYEETIELLDAYESLKQQWTALQDHEHSRFVAETEVPAPSDLHPGKERKT